MLEEPPLAKNPVLPAVPPRPTPQRVQTDLFSENTGQDAIFCQNPQGRVA